MNCIEDRLVNDIDRKDVGSYGSGKRARPMESFPEKV